MAKVSWRFARQGSLLVFGHTRSRCCWWRLASYFLYIENEEICSGLDPCLHTGCPEKGTVTVSQGYHPRSNFLAVLSFLDHVEPFGPFCALATLLGRFVSSGPLLASLAIFIHIWPHSTLKGFRPLGPFVVILGLILHSASLFFLFFVFSFF